MNKESVADFPMGPNLRAYFAIAAEDYRGDQTLPTDRDVSRFVAALTALARQRGFDNEDHLIDIADELVAMNVPEAVLQLRKIGEAVWTGTHFRGELAVGVAAMLTGDLETSEAALRRAQELMPEEPAPYVNLAIIALHERELDLAREWAEAGLRIEPNNFRLWEVLTDAYIEDMGEEGAVTAVKALAAERSSWAGYSLAAELEARGDIHLKAHYLKPFYDAGERDGKFLIEYTAALGMSGSYAEIPPIAWEAQRRDAQVPWELWMHAAQSHLAMDERDACLKVLQKLSGVAEQDHRVAEAVAALHQEALSADESRM